MPRTDVIPECPQPPAVRSSGRVRRVYEISLVAPLFGGGAEASRTDEAFPIRGTSIRGQLQFWWCRPAALGLRITGSYRRGMPRSGERRKRRALSR